VSTTAGESEATRVARQAWRQASAEGAARLYGSLEEVAGASAAALVGGRERKGDDLTRGPRVTQRDVYLSIFGPARPGPGPPMDLTGRAWAEIFKPAKFFLARALHEMLFLVT
jgi:hypothetical protein